MNRFFELLSWLHGEMRSAQAHAQRLHDAPPSAPFTPPAASASVVAVGAAVPGDAQELQRIQKHLYHCSALAERAVACVAGCLRDVEGHLAATKNGAGVSDADRTMVQALLQRTSTMVVRFSCLQIDVT